MKLIKTFKTNLFINVKFIKNKIFNKIKQHKIFSQIKIELKKNLKTLFKFFLFNKKILFLGINNKFNNLILNLIKNTKHFIINDNVWFKGFLTNFNTNKKFLFNCHQIHLILFLNENRQNLSELCALKTGIISFSGGDYLFFDYKFNFYYKSLFIFYLFLNFLKTRILQKLYEKF